MPKTVVGFVLVDAPHSALNNAGQDQGARTDNAVVVKVIRKGRSVYPYVSAQAWRFWWRRALEEKFGWTMSPIIREAKVAFTSANPFTYPDDDVFGYMRALKKGEGGTLTRLSPLKTSPLVSVIDHSPTNDFGVMARQAEGDPVPYEHQFYSTILKGIFSLDLDAVGVFAKTAKTGYKNLDDAYVKKEEIKKAIETQNAQESNGYWVLPRPVRVKRAKEAIAALAHIYSTTKGAEHLTDVTPKFVVLTVLDGGNHIFMNITDEDLQKPINANALRQVITDYKDLILSDIYIGRQDGFIDSCKEDLSSLVKDLEGIKTIHLSSPKQAIETFAAVLENYIR
ncbi:MAG: type I-B CRISPR-associated protein Cas7/Cst2/DevR [Bacteroidota bacterium]